MRPEIFVVVGCNVAAVAAIMYASTSGASWPLPFALFMVVLGGVFHLVSSRRHGC